MSTTEKDCPPVNTDPSQDNLLWLELWRGHQTDFHQSEVNPLLSRFWRPPENGRDSHVLVPLCGKSLDMLWLAAQGHRVTGVEISPVAVKAFFKENNLKAKKSRQGNFTCWRCGPISILCGDFFGLKKHQLGKIDRVFDRAALTALPQSIRDQYVGHLARLIDHSTHVFLLTTEDIGNSDPQRSDCVDPELLGLYTPQFDISLTHTESACTTAAVGTEQAFHTEHKVYQLELSGS